MIYSEKYRQGKCVQGGWKRGQEEGRKPIRDIGAKPRNVALYPQRYGGQASRSAFQD
jgi:hypothetical protein